jgi:hypothetical protein
MSMAAWKKSLQDWCYCANGNTRLQSFFMLITVQPSFFFSIACSTDKLPGRWRGGRSWRAPAW